MSYIIFRVACWLLVVIGCALFTVYNHPKPQYYVGIVLTLLFGALSLYPQILFMLIP